MNEVIYLKEIYILLSRTGTFPSKAIYFFTKRKYTHASIATEPQTDKFYSYARRRLYNFLIAGLTAEDVHTGVFGRFAEGECALFSLEVSDEHFEKIKKLSEHYWANYDKCKYKFSAIIPMWLGIKHKLKYKMTCSQFVASLLHDSGAVALPRPPSLMHPSDFLNIPGMKMIYSGKIKNCHFPAS